MTEKTASKQEKEADIKIRQGRSPAYPYIALDRAIERAEQISAAGAVRTATPPETFYKIWKLGASSSGAKQTMAALNQFGIVDYVGRGKDRKVILSELARKIVLDKIPNSHNRAFAIREAALKPGIHQDLWGKYGQFLPDTVVLEGFLTLEKGYNQQASKSLSREYLDTFSYARLNKSDNIPQENATEVEVMPPPAEQYTPSTKWPPAMALEHPTGMTAEENNIKVLLDGDRIRISAIVDAKGAKKLLKVLQANMALLDNDDE